MTGTHSSKFRTFGSLLGSKSEDKQLQNCSSNLVRLSYNEPLLGPCKQLNSTKAFLQITKANKCVSTMVTIFLCSTKWKSI
jgi:hypothetical protein